MCEVNGAVAQKEASDKLVKGIEDGRTSKVMFKAARDRKVDIFLLKRDGKDVLQ